MGLKFVYKICLGFVLRWFNSYLRKKIGLVCLFFLLAFVTRWSLDLSCA